MYKQIWGQLGHMRKHMHCSAFAKLIGTLHNI